MPHHHLHSSPETCHWGYFEAKLKPVLTIASGDEVTVDTVTGGPDVVPDRSKFHVPPELADIHARSDRMVPGHILTGSVAVAGAKLYLPVFVPGALFSCGDGHGVQGDGEVCVTAIETALQGRFRLTLRKDLRLDYPRAETPDHYMTMAMDPDLDQCVVRALRDMIVLLGEKRNLSREDAYTLCSLAADLRVTQTVNGSKGIHCMIAKTVVHG